VLNSLLSLLYSTSLVEEIARSFSLFLQKGVMSCFVRYASLQASQTGQKTEGFWGSLRSLVICELWTMAPQKGLVTCSYQFLSFEVCAVILQVLEEL